MRLLVISHQIGKSAPGIVFERLLSELTKIKDIEVDIIACEYNPSIEIKNRGVQVVHYPSLHYRLSNLMISIFKRDWISEFLKYKIKLNNNYDFILALCSSGHLFGLVSGLFLIQKINCKIGCYLVDAVPAPLGWSINDRLYRSTIKLIARLLSKVDLVASVNQEMLDYQKKLFVPKNGLESLVLLPSSGSEEVRIVEYKNDGIHQFLYTGNIYGLRTSKYVIEAFSKLLNEIKNVRLCFVGTTGGEVETEIKKYDEDVRKRIVVLPRTSDLLPYYKKATALIDIDAEIDNDVFLSSKMSSYLILNRPIICETGKNSPSRNLFKGIPSVIQCGHDAEELKVAMMKVIENYNSFDYSDRNKVLRMQSSKNVACNLYRTIKKLMDDEKNEE